MQHVLTSSFNVFVCEFGCDRRQSPLKYLTKVLYYDNTIILPWNWFDREMTKKGVNKCAIHLTSMAPNSSFCHHNLFIFLSFSNFIYYLNFENKFD